MSYEIVYSKQFIKTNDGKIIPLILSGSNNCYETLFNGRQRRSRDWGSIIGRPNINIAFTENEINDEISSWLGGEYQEHFKLNGKWVDDAALLRFIKSSIKNAKTIEELNDVSRCRISLKGYFSVWFTDGDTYNDGTLKAKNKIENISNIENSAGLDKFLLKSTQRINGRLETEQIYICIEFNGDKAIPYPKQQVTRKPKEKLTEYYAVKIISNRIYYLAKLTSRSIKGAYNIENAKQFKTSEEAEKWVKKYNIKKRFNVDCKIEFAKMNIAI